MLFNPANFLAHLKNLVMGDEGVQKDIFVPLSSMDLNTIINYDGSQAGAAVATLTGAHLAADETNARVVKVEETVDLIGRLTFPIPRDYDEHSDVLKVRVLASQLTSSTDNDVQLDSEFYVKTAGSALGSDLAPAAPSTVLSTTEQWIEFDLSGHSLQRDQVVTFRLNTDGHNDTDGEEVLIHAVSVVYRSTVVSYDDENDANGNPLR
jgi:hypothetical protein